MSNLLLKLDRWTAELENMRSLTEYQRHKNFAWYPHSLIGAHINNTADDSFVAIQVCRDGDKTIIPGIDGWRARLQTQVAGNGGCG